MDGRRQTVPPDRARAGEEQDESRRDNDSRASELAAVLAPREPQGRKQRMAERLRPEPRRSEEAERRRERRVHVEAANERHDHAELEEPERQRRPAGLIADRPVVHDVEREPRRAHQPGELDGPPRSQGARQRARDEERQHEDREPRLEPASQRVRHRLRNPCAA